jgi:hypothetical protein
MPWAACLSLFMQWRTSRHWHPRELACRLPSDAADSGRIHRSKRPFPHARTCSISDQSTGAKTAPSWSRMVQASGTTATLVGKSGFASPVGVCTYDHRTDLPDRPARRLPSLPVAWLRRGYARKSMKCLLVTGIRRSRFSCTHLSCISLAPIRPPSILDSEAASLEVAEGAPCNPGKPARGAEAFRPSQPAPHQGAARGIQRSERGIPARRPRCVY